MDVLTGRNNFGRLHCFGFDNVAIGHNSDFSKGELGHSGPIKMISNNEVTGMCTEVVGFHGT